MHPIDNPSETLLAEIHAYRARFGRTRATAYMFEDKPRFLKQTEDVDRPSIGIQLYNFISRALPPILRNARKENEKAALALEASRLLQWNNWSLPAPNLVAFYGDAMVTEDAGVWFMPVIRGADADTRMNYFKRALESLQYIHQKNHAHGRPMIKDIAISTDGIISWVDLEEDTESIMPISDAKARDLFIFLTSLMPHIDDQSAFELAKSAYQDADGATQEAMNKLMRWLSYICVTFKWIKPEKLGRELSNAIRLNHIWMTFRKT